MRKDLRLAFASEIKKVNKLKGEAKKLAYEELLERINMYDVANDFGYGTDILEKIKNAKNNIAAENVLIGAHHGGVCNA